MELRYVKADPTGNITALVESFSPALSRSDAASAVFAADDTIEQLGFLSGCTGADIALAMAGGEFCGNACLSAAAYHLRRCGLGESRVSVAISGAESPVTVEIKSLGENEYTGRLDMPLPIAIGKVRGMPLVRFPGICHAIAPASLSRAGAEALVMELCRELKAEAMGLMLYDAAAGSLSPLVYVPGADTLCWEHSCASGTSALGAWLSAESKHSQSLALRQRGGSLSISAEMEGGSLHRLILGGKVRLGTHEIIEI